MTAVGLLAGLGYGLLYGIVAGLAWRVSEAVSSRSQPSRRPLVSIEGALGGVLLGATVMLGASQSGVSADLLPAIGLTTSVAAAIAFGLIGPESPNGFVPSPQIGYKRDRASFWIGVAAVSLTLGLTTSVRAASSGISTVSTVWAGLSTMLTYGLTAGVVVGAASGRYAPVAAARLVRGWRGNLPFRLMTFLEDAHNRGVLRSNGAVYQFRHKLLLQAMLKDRNHS